MDQEQRPAGEHQGAVVRTIAARCRRCYHCVRHCPAKAIRVRGGQAEVLAERCVGCGRCYRVCAQQAKAVESGIPETRSALAGAAPRVMLLAPSYPAAFPQARPGQVVAALRRLGFDHVIEVGYGGEMVAREYARIFAVPDDSRTWISSPCPALTAFVRTRWPELADSLTPVVSPMVALGRAVKERLHPGASVVFAGPCIAKKAERREPEVAGVIDAVLTFQELARLIDDSGLVPAEMEDSEADDPTPTLGTVFPLAGGLLRTAEISADALSDETVVVDGDLRSLEALAAIAEGSLHARLVDMLLCEGGCLGGPGLPGSAVTARPLVTAHARRQAAAAAGRVDEVAPRLEGLDLSRTFAPRPITLPMPTEKEIRDLLARQNKNSPEDELNCGACGYPTCRDKVIAVYQGLAESEMCLPWLVRQLEVNVERLTRSKEEVEKARALATRAQHLAAMGELAADVAEQMRRPLGSMVAYGEMLRDSLPGEDARRGDAEAIVSEGLLCREVMMALEGFARSRTPRWERARLDDVVARALRALEPRLVGRPVEIVVRIAEGLPPFPADPAMIAHVIEHLATNSLDAIKGAGTVTIEGALSADGEHVELSVSDTGTGIPDDLLPRIFEPFVTTKATNAAGLGLAAAHGVIQNHNGELRIDHTGPEGTRVTMCLPLGAGPARPRESVRVLVVDDDPDVLEVHRILLTGAGYDVVAAERSDEALEVADAEIPDAFVLDLIMEKADSGARLARALRRDPRFRESPIIMVTSVVQDMGFEFRRNPREVLEWMRADAWIDKPADGPRLAALIERLLAERRPAS